MRNILQEFQFWPDWTTDHHFCSVVIYRILFKLASYKDMHKILDEFDIWPDPTTYCGVNCPCMSKKYQIDLSVKLIDIM